MNPTKIKNLELKKRIIDISFKHKLAHIGSCITAVDIIKEIYDNITPDDKFILSEGHAGLALYVVLESLSDKEEPDSAEDMLKNCGIHPDRSASDFIHCSTGSLGHGLGIGVGMALADRTRNVHVLISDGECSEGSIFEALRVTSENHLGNLYTYLNMNGYGAYMEIDKLSLLRRLNGFVGADSSFQVYETSFDEIPHLEGLGAHYKVLNEQEYKDIKDYLEGCVDA